MAFKEYPKMITAPDKSRVKVNSRQEEDKILGVKPVETTETTETPPVPTIEPKTKGKKGWN